jgi:outer membrane cobalamin receptor
MFRFSRACDSCLAIASLPGFNNARATVTANAPAVLTMNVAPVQESVVVTATRTEAPTSQVGAAVTVFTAQEIERRDVPVVADLLRSTPGATVVRAGGLGNVTSLFVRAGESSYNKVLLDGIPLNEPAAHSISAISRLISSSGSKWSVGRSPRCLAVMTWQASFK